MDGGNRYEAAIISVNDWGISIIIREAYRHASLHDVCSFPSRGKEEHRVYLDNSLLRYIEETDLDEEGGEERVVEEVELDSDWSE